jgi:hypothetical protein
VLADGASPPAPLDEGAADAPAPGAAAELPAPPADGAAEPPAPPDGAPADGASVGPYVQLPPPLAWAEHPWITTAAPSATASTILEPVERLRMIARMGLVVRRRARGNAGGRDSRLATEPTVHLSNAAS